MSALGVLRAAGHSRRGPPHAQNEDAFAIDLHAAYGDGGLFVVCDGVSTAGAGAAAARLATEHLQGFKDGRQSRDDLIRLVSEVDWELRGTGRQAACTLALAWVTGARATVLTVGDSPVYRCRRGRLKQAGAERTGTFRRLAAYLGMGPKVADVIVAEDWDLEAGDALFLLSDGVIEALDEDDLGRLWSRAPEPAAFVRAVIDEVARIGVDDDATIIAVTRAMDPLARSPAAPTEAPDPPRRLRGD